jgi:aminopeptidase N
MDRHRVHIARTNFCTQSSKSQGGGTCEAKELFKFCEPSSDKPYKQGWLRDWLANLGEPEVEREDRQDVQHFSIRRVARARQPVSCLEVPRTVVANGVLKVL